ncbi:MAG: hypothetical protein AAF224_13340 [Pseudomonadota bacterium]
MNVLYTLLVFVHIIAVVFAFGPTFAYPLFVGVAEKTNPRALPVIGVGIATWDKVSVPLMALIAIAGLTLVFMGYGSFNQFYVVWGIVATIAIFAQTIWFFMPKWKRLFEIVERDIEASGEGEVKFSAEYDALKKQIDLGGLIVAIIIVYTIYVMVRKSPI